MGLYYRLDYKKNSQYRNKEESYKVVIDYYYKGKKTKISTSISCLQKDWDKEWRNKSSKNPIKSSDKDYKQKNLIVKNKLVEVNRIVLTLQKQDKEPLVELVKSYLRKDRVSKKK